MPGNQVRRLRRILVSLPGWAQMCYEWRWAPWLARHLPWLFLPFRWAMGGLGLMLVAQVAEGTGHIVSDIDHFLRLRHTGAIARDRRYLLIRKRGQLSNGVVAVYRRHFHWAVASTVLYDLFLPVLLAYPEVSVDCGLSRLKTALPHRRDGIMLDSGELQISKRAGYDQWVDYYRLRAATEDYLPLAEGDWDAPELEKFLGGWPERLALVHIKTAAMNATALPTDPDTYIPALSYLAERGYRLVLIGREPMPAAFARLGVLDYAGNPKLASFANDLRLVRRAGICLISGSGVGWLPDMMNQPQVYLNYWHLFTPPFSRYCVKVPTLVRRPDGSLLSFSEQFKLYMDMQDRGAEVFPGNAYSPCNATADEVLEGVKEALALAQNFAPLSPSQAAYQGLDPQGWLAYAGCRISHSFIEHHRDLLDASSPIAYCSPE